MATQFMADADPLLTATCTLDQLKPGVQARVIGINEPDNRLGRRLIDLGFDTGAPVELMHRGPFGGNPLAVQVGSMLVALRAAEAEHVTVRMVA